MSTRWSLVLSLALAACASSTSESEPEAPTSVPASRPASQPAAETAPMSEADRLAKQIVESFGDPHELTGIQFGFEVQIEGQVALSRFHIWCPSTGKASVTSQDGETTVVDVEEMPDDPDEAEAHSTYINDSYWVFAPAKLMDPGVHREMTEDGELHIWFDEGVGYTSGDHYWFEIDRERDRVTSWRFRLESGREAEFTWEGYGKFGPLTLATTHIRSDGMIIRHPDMAVLTACPFE
jgi:hypothetical protein